MKEDSIASTCEKFLQRELGLETLREVPFLGRRIDIVGFDSDFREVTAIEVKVGNMSQALRQALLYRLCADKVYLAFDIDYAKRKSEDPAIGDYGIGLIGLEDGHSRIFKEAMRSDGLEESLRRDLIETITTLGGC